MPRHLVVTTGILLAVGSPAFAQVQPMGNASPQASTTQQEAVIPKQDDAQLRADRLIGSRAIGLDGQAVGKVEDFLIDRDRKVVGVVIGVGGFLGVGAKAVALPASRVDFSQAYGGDGTVKIDATKDELVAAPSFKSKEALQAEAEAEAAKARMLQQQRQVLPPTLAPSGAPRTQ